MYIADIHTEERARGHSNDSEFVSIHLDRPTENAGRLPIRLPPQPVTNHAYGWRARLVVRRLQDPSHDGWDAEGSEVISRNVQPGYFLMLVGESDGESGIEPVVSQNV